jgi:hypothetical protein
MMTNSTRESRQRKFYRDLFPFNGQHVAAHMGGYSPPSLEGQVAELKESFKLWQQVTASGADERIAESSWWFTQLADPHRRASMTEYIQQTGQLGAFAVGILGQLLEAGTIKWADEDMKLPAVTIEAEGLVMDGKTLTEDEEIDVARLLSELNMDGEE